MKRSLVSLTAIIWWHSYGTFAETPRVPPGKELATNVVKPEYPLYARQHRWQGSGLLELHLRPDGSVQSVIVKQSTGHRILDDAAVTAYRQWRFHPGLKVIQLPFTFTM